MGPQETPDRPFMPGLELCELFYREAVAPILADHFPQLPYSAALFGRGSEVLGFDTPQSMDHDWGPRLMLFLSEADHGAYAGRVDQVLRTELPPEVHGYPTNMSRHGDGTAVMAAQGPPVDHAVRILTTEGFCRYVLNLDPGQEMQPVDWLTLPEQVLRAVTGGRVYHDGLGELAPLRARLHYYPRDVWLYLLSNQWRRISQEEAFPGRCAQVGDEIGSRLVAARLVRDLMRLCFLLEQRYAPYIKWFGTAFAQLDCAPQLSPILERILGAARWREREEGLSRAYERVARMHNALGITAPLSTQVTRFHNRPFVVLHSERFAEAIHAEIADDQVRALPTHLGAIDQFADSTDVLDDGARYGKLKLVYGA